MSHLMVRDGLLSPNSKLLPGAASRAATPMDGRPGSMLSVVSQGSVMTKSGIIKDERDTPMRRVRHRDGKLLRGGIGLTTGLGWSDRSSASSIMTGTTSASRPPGSFGQRHPLSRSFSSGALSEHQQSRRSFPRHEFDEFDDDYLEEEDEEGDVDNTLKETGEWAQAQRQRSRIPSGGSSILSRPPSKSSLPPTSWQHRTTTSGVSGISRSSGGTVASRTSRTSTSSVGSTFSLEVTTPDGEARTKTPSLSRIRTPSGGAHGLGLRRDSTESSGAATASGVGIGRPSAMKKGSRDDVSVTTPSSTASTLSIPMPATPKDADQDVGEDEMSASTTPVPGSKIRLGYNKDKSLPPLPLRSVPSLSRVDGTTTTRSTTSSSGIAAPGSKYAFPRARTFSSTSSASASASTPSPPSAIPKTSTSPTSPKVRPLQLPRHAARAAGDRPAVPVPSVLSSSASRGSLRTPSLGSATLSPTSPNSASASVPSSPLPSPDLNGAGTGIAKPKPRTGTGMVYRSSSSKMRPPMVLSSSMSSGISVSASTGSNAATAGSIGRRAGSGIGKPIAL
ncbi:hypothetical protein CVT26_004481 [Gymnopilus dilepis]|uniref:Uncharacterized protein n=1 Tax=Gymnopilus dilepis TaxID=231916 RepID=A0A409WDS6_9AGAR|nr:hypothetical protein CVT26_004481 [Gymnopilus dilepis]